VKEYLRNLSAQENNRRRANFHDRGIGTFADGYLSAEELSTISNEFLKSSVSVGIRDRCAFLLAHYAMIRGENIRNLEFADLLTVHLPNEGPDTCIALVLMMLQGIFGKICHVFSNISIGKVNQFGRREYAAMIRSKDVAVCGIGALALYFFYRFHHAADLAPTLQRSQDWFNIKVTSFYILP
jgi:hypothetical protein